MKTIVLKAQMRNNLGSGNSKRLRAEGFVPCVVYGETENTNVFIHQNDFKHLVYTPNVYKVQLNVEDKSHSCILKDMQFHPISESIVHADFFVITDSKVIEMEIPVEVEGKSPGVANGGNLSISFPKLTVKGIMPNMPDSIKVDISGLYIGDSVKVRDLKVDDIEIVTPAANAVVSVRMTRAAMSESVEEAEEEDGEGTEEGEGSEEKSDS